MDSSTDNNKPASTPTEPDPFQQLYQPTTGAPAQQPGQLPAVSGSPSMYDDPLVPPRRSHKKAIIITLLVVLLAAGGVFGWLYFSNQEKAPATDTATTASKPKVSSDFVPRFTDVKSVVELDGAKWYVVDGGAIKVADDEVKVYGNTEGVPTGAPINAVVYEKQLWVASLSGFARYDAAQDKFVASNTGTSPSGQSTQNGRLFVDTASNQLYGTEFERFQVYDKTSSKWIPVPNIQNAQSFAANDKFIALYASQPGWPVWVYNKSTKAWTKNSPPIEEQSGTVLQLNDQIFILARSKGYTSCDSADTVAATSAFRLDDKGVWQPDADFNKDLKRPELSPIAQVGTGAQGVSSGCGQDATNKTYDITYDGKTLHLKNERTDAEYRDQPKLLAEITEATGFHASMHVVDVDGAGNAIVGYADEPSQSSIVSQPFLAVAKGNDLTQTTALDMSSDKNFKERENIPVMCGSDKKRELSYVFSGKINIPPSNKESFPDGYWAVAELYSVQGSKLSQVIDLGKDVAVPTFACDDKYVTWLGKSGLRRLDRTSGKISSLGAPVSSPFAAGIPYNASSAAVTPTGNLWFSVQNPGGQTSSLYHYDAYLEKYTVASKSINGGTLVTGSDTHVVVGANEKEQKLTWYDKTGKAEPSVGGNAPVAFMNGKDTYAVLQDEGTDVFHNFSVNTLKIGSPLTKSSAKLNGFTQRYSSDGAFFGVVTKPMLVYDAKHTQLWLNDDQSGTSIVKNP